jgi:hypothetical protein
MAEMKHTVVWVPAQFTLQPEYLRAATLLLGKIVARHSFDLYSRHRKLEMSSPLKLLSLGSPMIASVYRVLKKFQMVDECAVSQLSKFLTT